MSDNMQSMLYMTLVIATIYKHVIDDENVETKPEILTGQYVYCNLF
jgi:hypothetical protein